MSFFDKIYDIAHIDLFKYVFHSGSDKVFVANISKISETCGLKDSTLCSGEDKNHFPATYTPEDIVVTITLVEVQICDPVELLSPSSHGASRVSPGLTENAVQDTKMTDELSIVVK